MVAILPQQQPGGSSLLPVQCLARLPLSYCPQALALVKQGAAEVMMVNAKALILGVMATRGGEHCVHLACFREPPCGTSMCGSRPCTLAHCL